MLVNLEEGFKAIDIDLISRHNVKSFSFIIADPTFKVDYKLVDFNQLYAAEEIIEIEDEKDLRRYLVEDMAYSQALVKIGYSIGAGDSQSTTAEALSNGTSYISDGLRAVLVFGHRPASLERIDFFDWERPADHR